MAMKIAKSARMSWKLNAGTNPGTGKMFEQSVSISNIMPNASADALVAVGEAISDLFEKPVLVVSLTETYHLI